MDLREFQIKSSETDQHPRADKLIDFLIPLLGLVGEMGSAISEFKKRIRDGSSYQQFKPHLEEELGDILWYLANIATKMDLDLAEIARKNIEKTQNRWSFPTGKEYVLFDEEYSDHEQLPRQIEIEFREVDDDDKTKVLVLINGREIGDPLTDNVYEDDGYRYHDIFHYGFAAYLGWSPVLRKLLRRKRKSKPKIDEVEDGARAAIIEEAISAYIFPYAGDLNFFRGVSAVDYEILKTIQRLVSPFEVRNRTLKEWEFAILESYRIYRHLRVNHGGKLKVNLHKRSIDII